MQIHQPQPGTRRHRRDVDNDHHHWSGLNPDEIERLRLAIE